ncbi:MAG: hypothetical protein M0T72_03060 [Candidatus Dormibacteraeota bacterium]|nr:hypothetical protein [Candidatus Dormibacteraeota bacterium]
MAGEFVEAAQPHSEADPAALLVSFLAAFGSAVGPGPHAVVGATRHPARLFAVLVGQSAKARKGESWSPVSRVLAAADPSWAARVQQGLSTGEGVISAVRDRLEREGDDGEVVVVDPGVADKRLLALAPEFGRVLRVMARDGNTLSAVIREGWDSGDLRVMTKQPTIATGAHLVIVGHVSLDELRQELRALDAASGFANRFLWLAVKRWQLLPDPPPFEGPKVSALAGEVAAAIARARTLGVVPRDPEATELWRQLYPTLSADRPGLAGAVVSRHEAQAVRVSVIYSLLDRSPVVRVEHLEATVALLDYCAASATYIFGDRLGDPVADAILAALREAGEMTRAQIWGDLLGRQTTKPRIEAALRLLAESGLAHQEMESSGGRPVEIWQPGAALTALTALRGGRR